MVYEDYIKQMPDLHVERILNLTQILHLKFLLQTGTNFLKIFWRPDNIKMIYIYCNNNKTILQPFNEQTRTRFVVHVTLLQMIFSQTTISHAATAKRKSLLIPFIRSEELLHLDHAGI